MPLYEYLCTKCGKRTEALQRVGADPLKECPECGGALERLISAPAIQFKGSGWYVTDYAKRNSPGESGSSSSGAPGKGSESKPAEKSADKPASSSDTKPKAS